MKWLEEMDWVACTLYAGRKAYGFDEERAGLRILKEGCSVTTMGVVTAVTPRQCWACGRSLEPTSTLEVPPALMRATPLLSLARRSCSSLLSDSEVVGSVMETKWICWHQAWIAPFTPSLLRINVVFR